MPFEERQGKDVELSLGYGEQTDPVTGKEYFHHGIDFDVRCYTLPAVSFREWETTRCSASARASAMESMK